MIYHFKGDSKQNEMSGMTKRQYDIFKRVKLQATPNKKIELSYTQKTINAIRKLTGINSNDDAEIWKDFISKINLDIK
jgi:hypothetical protein